ncbi:hypothetical protein GE061_012793 [Apolygus lucorum]|uniref:Uncharacterized protein n=1 Tax=Apolygus lucorum TaxID=248454 RepID=A0A8S9XVE0_APOLU|nr:hypothetical protein GE061_012793 [Apolygus lucorum]
MDMWALVFVLHMVVASTQAAPRVRDSSRGSLIDQLHGVDVLQSTSGEQIQDEPSTLSPVGLFSSLFSDSFPNTQSNEEDPNPQDYQTTVKKSEDEDQPALVEDVLTQLEALERMFNKLILPFLNKNRSGSLQTMSTLHKLLSSLAYVGDSRDKGTNPRYNDMENIFKCKK